MDKNTYRDGNPIYEPEQKCAYEPFNDLIAICRTSQYLSCEVLEDEERGVPFLSVYMNDKEGKPVTDWALRFYEDDEIYFENFHGHLDEGIFPWKKAERNKCLDAILIISIFRLETANDFYYVEKESEIRWPEL